MILKKHGCTLTCIAMCLEAVGKTLPYKTENSQGLNIDPLSLLEFLKAEKSILVGDE
jgi:hypothetical protein